MRVRKVLLASLLALGVMLGGGQAIGAPAETKGGGPACADIVRAWGRYISPDESGKGTLTTGLTMAGPSCKGMTYTIYALDDRGDDTVLATRSVRGNKDATVPFGDVAVADDDPEVCVYATTSAGAHVFDRAPAEGCAVPETLPPGPGPLANDPPNDFRWGP